MGLISSAFSCTEYLPLSNISFMSRCRASKKFLLSRQILRTSFLSYLLLMILKFLVFLYKIVFLFLKNGQFRVSFIVSKAFLQISFCFFFNNEVFR